MKTEGHGKLDELARECGHAEMEKLVGSLVLRDGSQTT
jgi:hypothetical protein